MGSTLAAFCPFAGAATCGTGGVLWLALSSGQATPRSGIGASGALGSSSAASGGGVGGGDVGGGAACASAVLGTSTVIATAHSSRAAPTREPRPIIQLWRLNTGPEPRQYVPARSEGLVDGSAHFVAAERRYDALDLPPVAEPREIALVPTALGARRRLEAGVVAETFDQVRRISERQPAMDERTVHACSLGRLLFPDCRQVSS